MGKYRRVFTFTDTRANGSSGANVSIRLQRLWVLPSITLDINAKMVFFAYDVCHFCMKKGGHLYFIDRNAHMIMISKSIHSFLAALKMMIMVTQT